MRFLKVKHGKVKYTRYGRNNMDKLKNRRLVKSKKGTWGEVPIRNAELINAEEWLINEAFNNETE